MSRWLLGRRRCRITTQWRDVLVGLALVASLLVAIREFGSSYVTAAANTTTATYLNASPNPSTSGQAVTFSVSVVPSSATGTVSLVDGSTSLATVRLSSAHATFTTSTLSSGSHSIVANYSGDAANGASSSAPFTQVVRAVSTTSVGSSANPSTYGQPVTLTATVAPAQATGTVVFRDGSTMLGSAGLAQGTASIATSSLGAYTHSITAAYGGDGSFAGSVSATLLQNVAAGSGATTHSAPQNPGTAGQALRSGQAPAGGVRGGAGSWPTGRTPAGAAVNRSTSGSSRGARPGSDDGGSAVGYIGLTPPEGSPSAASDVTGGVDSSATVQQGSRLAPAVLAALALLGIGGLVVRHRRRQKAARLTTNPFSEP